MIAKFDASALMLITCYVAPTMGRDPELRRYEGGDKQVGYHADVCGCCENAALPLISPSLRQIRTSRGR